jgi:hypothetical protein
MDRNSLIALSMLMSLMVCALFKGAVEGHDVKEVVLVLAGGIFGNMLPRVQRRPNNGTTPETPDPAPGDSSPRVSIGR